MKQQMNILVKIASVAVAFTSVTAFARGKGPAPVLEIERPAPEIAKPGSIERPVVTESVVSAARPTADVINTNLKAVLPAEIVANNKVMPQLKAGLASADPAVVASAEKIVQILGSNDAKAAQVAVSRLEKGLSLETVANTTLFSNGTHEPTLDPTKKTGECLAGAAFDAAFTDGMSAQEKQEYLRDVQTAENATGKRIVTQGACDGGLNKYDLPARKNMRKIFHDMVARNAFGLRSLAEAYRNVMKADWAKSLSAANKFTNVCGIAAPAGA